MTPAPSQVWLVVEPVDMRSGIEGLSQRIQNTLGRSPCDGSARALRLFDEGIAHILPPEDLHNGQYLGENRRGETVFYSAPTLSIGALQVFAGDFDSHHAISAVAASAKKHAKKMPGSSLFIERRRRQAGTESAEMQGSLRSDALNVC
jgi:hypothetical protein